MSERYFVGTKIVSTVDNSRAEMLGPMTGSRVVSARLYYPSEDATGKKVELGKNCAGDIYSGIEPVKNKQFPLIVYNHGYGEDVECNNKLCSELAANGYIVAAVGHAYEASQIVLESGTVIKKDKNLDKMVAKPAIPALMAMNKLKKASGTPVEQYKQFLEFQRKYSSFMVDRLDQWAKDILTIIEEVKNRYEEQIDLNNGIGITGHSFGGTMAYYMCHKYTEYKCGVNIDGPLFGHYDDSDMDRPFLQISSEENQAFNSRSLFGSVAPVYYAVFKDLKHVGFTDVKLTNDSKMTCGAMPPDVMSNHLIRFHMQFFDKYMKDAEDKLELVASNDLVVAKKVH